MMITRGHAIKNRAAYPENTSINKVEAYEENEDGINWKLLTSRPLKSHFA